MLIIVHQAGGGTPDGRASVFYRISGQWRRFCVHFYQSGAVSLHNVAASSLGGALHVTNVTQKNIIIVHNYPHIFGTRLKRPEEHYCLLNSSYNFRQIVIFN